MRNALASRPPPSRYIRDTIAVVDDNERILDLCRKSANREGFVHVSTASGFEEGLALAAGSPELFLVDINLGEDQPDGIELVRRLRLSGCESFICMMTAFSDERTLFEALMASADDYFIKPWELPRKEIRMMVARARGEVRVEPGFDDGIHGRYLHARGLTDGQVEAVAALVRGRYPEGKLLAAQMGISERALSKRLVGARQALELENESQLVSFLTILTAYGSRYR